MIASSEIDVLPEGYIFTPHPEGIAIDKICEAVGWSFRHDMLQDSTDLAVLGVSRGGSGELIGMGMLTGNTSSATLRNLAVKPEHRGQGIGRTIVRERVRLADELGVGRLDTTVVDRSPVLPLYYELGFKFNGIASNHSSRLVRTRPGS
jgi:GNAT superfamily N-acetyltransferase